jgi:predicted DNA-binding protein
MEQKPKKDYQTAPIRLPAEVKRRVRVLAAEKDTTMSDMAGELLLLGLAEYESGSNGKKGRKTA